MAGKFGKSGGGKGGLKKIGKAKKGGTLVATPSNMYTAGKGKG